MMKIKYIIIILLCLISCDKKYGSFDDQFAFITEHEGSILLNAYNNEYNLIDKSVFIYFVDGSCDLCSLDLSEVENLRKSIFSEYNISPLVVIYGGVNNYTSKLINEKNIFNYPIYNISYSDYDSLMSDKSNVNALVIGSGGKILYEGNPLTEKNKFDNFLSIIVKI